MTRLAPGDPAPPFALPDDQAALPVLDGAGLAVVGVSPDPPAALAAFRDAEELGFALLSDPDRQVLAACGAYGERLDSTTVTASPAAPWSWTRRAGSNRRRTACAPRATSQSCRGSSASRPRVTSPAGVAERQTRCA